jgi:DNA repair protein RecO (recombination protein O)
MVTSCQVIETFYPLRLDYSRLSFAAAIAGAVLKIAQPDEPVPHLFILLVRSLKRLAYSDVPGSAIACAFFMHFSMLSGFKPRLNHCVRCGRLMGQEEDGYLLNEEGGVCCLSCGSGEPKRLFIPVDNLQWLREILAVGIDKVASTPARVPYTMIVSYVEHYLDYRLPEVPAEYI